MQAITLLQFPFATELLLLFYHVAFEDTITKQPTVQHNNSEYINRVHIHSSTKYLTILHNMYFLNLKCVSWLNFTW